VLLFLNRNDQTCTVFANISLLLSSHPQAAGAMENWGLVTYREVDLLIDPLKASNSQKQRVCTVVTHELAHQVYIIIASLDFPSSLDLVQDYPLHPLPMN
jgi:hypothetical protein